MTHRSHQDFKYFLYARKSSDNEDRQVQSIDDQIKFLKEVAGKHNLQIVEVFTESKSAKKPYIRPVFADMIKRIERGEAEGILCWKLDRLARNAIDGGMITHFLQCNIVKHIKTFDGGFSPEDNVLLMSIEFGIANQYIIDLRRNSWRGMVGRAERGWFPTMPPAGYINDKNEKVIVTDRERFPLIRKMWDLMLTGSYTVQQIRKVANNEWGFRTRQFKRQGGGQLAACTMYKLFTNIFYTGMFEWDGKLYNGKHEPMVTLEEYDKVQMLLGKNGRPRPQQHNFAYTGILRCGECGCMITGTEKQKLVKKDNTIRTYSYYHCTKKSKSTICTQKPVTLEQLEAQILVVLAEIWIPEKLLNWITEVINSNNASEIEQEAKIRQMREQSLAKTENELANLTRMRYRDLIDDEAFLAEKRSLKEQIIRLKQKLQNENLSEKKILTVEKLLKFAANAKENFIHSPVKEKKEILLMLGSNFSINDKILLFEKADYIKLLQKCLPPLVAEFSQLELTTFPYFPTQNAKIQHLIMSLRASVEDVRTAIYKSIDIDNETV